MYLEHVLSTVPVGLDIEHALEALRPCHSGAALGGRLVFGAIARWPSPPGRRDGGTMGAVGGKDAVVADEIDARFGDQSGQACNKVHRFEEHVGGAVTMGGFEFVAHEAVGSQREAFFGERGAGDVAGETFELVAFPRCGGHAGMNGEAARLGRARAGARRLSLGRQGLKCESLAPLAGPEGNAVDDGTAEHLGQAIVIARLELGWRESQQIVARRIDCRPVL